MSITYKIITGDTFETIARKQYGTELSANQIARANPGVAEPLVVGTEIIIPQLPNAPRNLSQKGAADSENEVAVLIDGERFRFWDTIRIVRALDTMDVVDFSAPFESEAPKFRETFRPFSYKPLQVTLGGDPFFTGTLVGVNPNITPDRKTLVMSGYSLPGVLNDCTAPASSYPLEFSEQNLREIATSLAEPFGVSVEFLEEPGATFELVAMEPSEKVFEFLVRVAKQRNLILSSSPEGKLIFWRSIETGNPVAQLRQGEPPLLSVTPFFNPQEYYSHVTGLDPVLVGLEGSQFTVKNPRLAGITRPITFSTPDSQDADTKAAVEAKAGRMFGSMASYSISVATWRDSAGKLWEPNTLITLEAPDAMIYNQYTFVIRSIEFEKDEKSETAVLNLVIPGSFSGKTPETLPWDE